MTVRLAQDAATRPRGAVTALAGPGPAAPRTDRGVRYGWLERSLALAAAAESLITSVGIYREHGRAHCGDRVMWWPALLGPAGTAAGVAGLLGERAARAALPIASAAIAANGLQGAYVHVCGAARGPRSRRGNGSGPPLPPFAPLLRSLIGAVGLLACVLRRKR